METQYIILAAGVVVTVLLGIGNLIYNIRLSRRTAFINTVTSERVKWIGTMRDNLSKFVGLNHHWFVSRPRGDDELDDTMRLEEVKRDLRVLKYLIKLQLNPNPKATIDRAIMALVDEIADKASTYKVDELLKKLDALVAHGQKLLNAEWNKVKREAGGHIG